MAPRVFAIDSMNEVKPRFVVTVKYVRHRISSWAPWSPAKKLCVILRCAFPLTDSSVGGIESRPICFLVWTEGHPHFLIRRHMCEQALTATESRKFFRQAIGFFTYFHVVIITQPLSLGMSMCFYTEPMKGELQTVPRWGSYCPDAVLVLSVVIREEWAWYDSIWLFESGICTAEIWKLTRRESLSQRSCNEL